MAAILIPVDGTTLVLNGRAITSFVEGDYLEMTPVNPLTSRTNSADGGVNVSTHVSAGVHDVIVRVQRYGEDDAWLNNAVNQGAVLFNGSVKEVFQRDGVEFTASTILENGSITTLPTVVGNNTDGNSVMEYTIQFRNVRRNI